MSQDAPRRTRLADARQVRMDRPEAAAAYEQTRLRYQLAERSGCGAGNWAGPSASWPSGRG